MGGRLQELLLSCGSFRWCQLASAASRCDAGGDLSRTACRARGLQEADGLAFQMVIVPRQRLQFRLSRFVHRGRGEEERGLLQLSEGRIYDGRASWPERVL